jgi:hypothetical protein
MLIAKQHVIPELRSVTSTESAKPMLRIVLGQRNHGGRLKCSGHIDRRMKRRIDSCRRWQSPRSSELKKKISKNFFDRQMVASVDATSAR